MAAVQQVLMAVGTSIRLPSSLVANPSAESYSDEPGSSAVVLYLNTDGSLVLEYNANGTLQEPPFPVAENYTWRVGGSSSLYSARMRRTSGNNFAPGSTSINTWNPITTNQMWSLLSFSNSFQRSDSKAVTAVLEIAFTNNLTNILAQCNISFSTSALTQGGFIP